MNASIRFVVWGGMPLASLLADWLGTAIGVVPTLWTGVVGSVVTVLPVLAIDRVMARSGTTPHSSSRTPLTG
ncbi:hypothetical protein ACFVWY_01335 [Streptomyces sp. NPDC058195]|uniref:hypothetical protein n=1 Tax=Streptomyces sp. NPDC058195 TaxID=3346375 RepID=UPI0036E411D3